METVKLGTVLDANEKEAIEEAVLKGNVTYKPVSHGPWERNEYCSRITIPFEIQKVIGKNLSNFTFKAMKKIFRDRETGEIHTNMTAAEFESLKKGYKDTVEALGMIPGSFVTTQAYLAKDQEYVKEQRVRRVERLQAKQDIFDSAG